MEPTENIVEKETIAIPVEQSGDLYPPNGPFTVPIQGTDIKIKMRDNLTVKQLDRLFNAIQVYSFDDNGAISKRTDGSHDAEVIAISEIFDELVLDCEGFKDLSGNEVTKENIKTSTSTRIKGLCIKGMDLFEGSDIDLRADGVIVGFSVFCNDKNYKVKHSLRMWSEHEKVEFQKKMAWIEGKDESEGTKHQKDVNKAFIDLYDLVCQSKEGYSGRVPANHKYKVISDARRGLDRLLGN